MHPADLPSTTRSEAQKHREQVVSQLYQIFKTSFFSSASEACSLSNFFYDHVWGELDTTGIEKLILFSRLFAEREIVHQDHKVYYTYEAQIALDIGE